MPRKSEAIAFTPRELEVMSVLWEWGAGTVSEVRDALDESFAYTTVLSVLRTLEEKGYVTHDEDGRAHRYRPLVDRRTAGQSAVARIVKTIFRGSPELLLSQMVRDQGLSEADLRRLKRMVDQRLRELE